MNISEKYNWVDLTPNDDAHYFFGYYDRCAWDKNNQYHLALRVDQCERIPERGESADLGYVTADGSGFVKLTSTRTWCHQQGCMSLWLNHLDKTFVYNDYDEKSDSVIARIFEIGKGVVGQYERAVYAISNDGKYAASLNFARIPRRGYSYADAVLPARERHPDLDNDGVFLIDLHSGKSRLLISYRQIAELHPIPYMLDTAYWWINHIIFNSDSSKLLFLFRTCDRPESPSPWKTFMYTINLDGSDPACTLPDVYWRGMISHQIWGRTPDEILVDANWRGQGHEYIAFDNRIRPPQGKRISAGQGPMGHLVFSPDGEWMLADSYPSKESIQSLALVKSSTGELEVIGRFNHVPPPIDSVRCDLHPRWSRDGKIITLDSNHSGKRKIYMLNFDDSVKF